MNYWQSSILSSVSGSNDASVFFCHVLEEHSWRCDHTTSALLSYGSFKLAIVVHQSLCSSHANWQLARLQWLLQSKRDRAQFFLFMTKPRRRQETDLILTRSIWNLSLATWCIIWSFLIPFNMQNKNIVNNKDIRLWQRQKEDYTVQTTCMSSMTSPSSLFQCAIIKFDGHNL